MQKIDTILICGAVDDGKSTLAGRLLYESRLVATDVSEAARGGRDARDGLPDFAYLMDGLLAEREQAITIDVAWRHCWLGNRRYFLVDSPGHEEHTRNMAAAASFGDCAVMTVDVARGITRQTRRHSAILSLLGVRSVVLAVNKMDAVGFEQARFDAIASEYLSCARELGLASATCVPLSALYGDNVVAPSARMPWHRGPTLAGAMESHAAAGDTLAAWRLPVQWVCRAPDFRGYCGTLAAGTLRRGDRVRVLPSGRSASVKRIGGPQGELESAQSGTAVNVTLDQEIDIARGDVLVADSGDHPELALPALSDRIEASLVWLSDEPLQPDKRYEIRVGTATAAAWVRNVFGRLDLDTLQTVHANGLAVNEIGRGRVHFDRPLVLDLYNEEKALGGFVLLERVTNETVAMGMVERILPSSRDVVGPEAIVTPRMRADLLGQQPRVVWLTGLSGAGKSTLAAAAERILHARGMLTFLLDGDLLRSGLSENLGFTDADREENIRRAAEAAKLLHQAGAIVLVALISPFRAERERIRSMFPPGDFLEAYVSAPLEVCESRDPKGLYRRARAGQLRHFTGVDSPYESPQRPDLVIDTAGRDVDSCVAELVERILQRDG